MKNLRFCIPIAILFFLTFNSVTAQNFFQAEKAQAVVKAEVTNIDQNVLELLKERNYTSLDLKVQLLFGKTLFDKLKEGENTSSAIDATYDFYIAEMSEQSNSVNLARDRYTELLTIPNNGNSIYN